MGASWADRADAVLAGVFQSLPADADEDAITRACRDAYPFGERSRFPYKVWGQRVKAWRETRAALIRSGNDPARMDLRPLSMRFTAEGT